MSFYDLKRSMTLAADECRDARGLSFIDDCARDVLYAFRTFGRAPLAALVPALRAARIDPIATLRQE